MFKRLDIELFRNIMDAIEKIQAYTVEMNFEAFVNHDITADEVARNLGRY